MYPREATSPNLYPYVWSEFGGKWVLFQSILEQEGYANMGMLIFLVILQYGYNIQYSDEATALYIISDT